MTTWNCGLCGVGAALVREGMTTWMFEFCGTGGKGWVGLNGSGRSGSGKGVRRAGIGLVTLRKWPVRARGVLLNGLPGLGEFGVEIERRG